MNNVKKLFASLFFALLLMPVLVLAGPPFNGTVQTLGAIRIKNQTFYSPYPVEPGKYFDFYIAVRNQDKNTVNAVCSFVESFPFSLDSNEQANRILDSFAPDTELLLKYKIRVAETAVEGSNPVKFKCYESSAPSVVYIIDLPVYVQPQDAVILVSSVVSSPETFSPGSAGTLKVVLKSEAKIELKDVRVKLDVSSSTLPFAPASGTSTKKIASLPAGETAELVFGLLSSPDAAPGLYKTTLEMSYYDRLGKQYSRNETVGLVVAAVPEVTVSVESDAIKSSNTRGTVVFKVVNSGLGEVKLLSAQLVSSPGQYRVLSPSYQYVGNINSDNYETVEYEVFVEENATSPLVFPLKLSFKDSSNKEYVTEYRPQLEIFSQAELVSLKYRSEGGTGIFEIVIGLAVLLVLWKFVWPFVSKKMRGQAD